MWLEMKKRMMLWSGGSILKKMIFSMDVMPVGWVVVMLVVIVMLTLDCFVADADDDGDDAIILCDFHFIHGLY